MRGHINEKDLALLAGGDLEAAGQSEFKRHLAECETCAGVLQNYHEDREAMGRLRMRDLRAGDYAAVRESVLARIRSGDAIRTAPTRLLMLRWGALAAGTVVALIFCLWWVRGPKSVPAPSGPLQRDQAKTEPNAPSVRDSILQNAAVPGTIAEDLNPPRMRNGRAPARLRRTETQMRTQTAAAARSAQDEESRVPVLDDVVVKLETEDPNVIIIWLNSPRGEVR